MRPNCPTAASRATHAYHHAADSILRAHRPAGEWTDPSQDRALQAAREYAAAQPAERAAEVERYFWPSIAAGTGLTLGAPQRIIAAGEEGFVGFVGTDPRHPPVFSTSPRPLTVDLLPTPALPSALIPAPLRDWVQDIAAREAFPMEYAAVAALVSLSAVVGRKVGIRPKRHDDWTVACADAFRNGETILHSLASFAQLASIEGLTCDPDHGVARQAPFGPEHSGPSWTWP